ncbi:hypothetical protein [Bradyrhizobium sp. AZCC 2289]|uniref:hypothetical protein n=1 Tax=Bradyrhizobium sp. AZCC 2289 TaxID=3117026 RepID=UPI002FEF7154
MLSTLHSRHRTHSVLHRMRTDGWSHLVDIETRLAELLACDGLAKIRGDVGFM